MSASEDIRDVVLPASAGRTSRFNSIVGSAARGSRTSIHLSNSHHNLNRHLSQSQKSLRSLRNLTQEDLRSLKRTSSILSAQLPLPKHRNDKQFHCCRLSVCYTSLQIMIGVVITIFGFVMVTSPSLKVRDTPYWSGIPLLVSGMIGMVYCALDREPCRPTPRSFFLKLLSCALSAFCTFLCLTAATFPAIHSHNINTYLECDYVEETRHCQCFRSTDPRARLFIYLDVSDCINFLINLHTYLLFECVLNIIAGVVSFSFVVLMWRQRYENFHAGLKFFSYAAYTTNPWANPNRPPYLIQKMTNGKIPVQSSLIYQTPQTESIAMEEL